MQLMRHGLRVSFFGLGLFAVLVLPGGCSNEPSGGTVAGNNASAAPPSDEECRKFADSLVADANSGNVAAINEKIDWDAILEKAMAHVDAPEAKRGFLEGFNGKRNTSEGLAGMLVQQINQGGNYRCLRVHEQDDGKRALFRLVQKEGSVNYHDFVLERRSDGNVRATDIYVVVSGEMLSATLRNMFLPAAADENKSFFDRLTGKENSFIKNFPKIQQVTTAVRSGNYRAALDSYKSLPVDMQQEKSVLILALVAAMRVGDDDAYQSVLQTFMASHAGNPAADAASIDYFFLRKEYRKSLAAAMRLDRFLGGDAHLENVCATLYLLQDKIVQARAQAQKAIENEEDFAAAYDTLLRISCKEKDFDESVRVLDLMKAKLHSNLCDVEPTEENSEFLKSQQYQEWKNKQERK